MLLSQLVCMVLSRVALPVAAAQLPPVPKAGDTSTEPKPRLFVLERVQDLGTVMEGDKVTATWRLENHGNADLVIDKATSSCGCAVVKLAEADKVIRPAGSLELQVVFDSTRRRGPQKKQVTVETNDPTEAKLKLEFTAKVDYLFEVDPPTLLNLQMLRRGETAAKTLEIIPGPGRSTVEVLGVALDEDAPLTCRYKPFQAKSGTGQRFQFTVKDEAALGRLKTEATVKLNVDGVERERAFPIHGEIVGGLDVHPKLVDATRQTSTRGKQLAPVIVRSTEKTPFDVLASSAGPLFDVQVEPVKSGPERTNYRFLMTIRDDAPPGPFGATLEVRTTSIEQPVVSVPVFGIVAPLIDVDPPIVLLRQDGTPAGTRRRVRIKTSLENELEISEIRCDHQAVTASLDHEAGSRYRHVRFLDVRLTGEPPVGLHEGVLVLTTNVEGAERVEIPIRIEVPEASRPARDRSRDSHGARP